MEDYAALTRNYFVTASAKFLPLAISAPEKLKNCCGLLVLEIYQEHRISTNYYLAFCGKRIYINISYFCAKVYIIVKYMTYLGFGS